MTPLLVLVGGIQVVALRIGDSRIHDIRDVVPAERPYQFGDEARDHDPREPSLVGVTSNDPGDEQQVHCDQDWDYR